MIRYQIEVAARRVLVERLRAGQRQPEEALVRLLREAPPIRLPGTAAFLTAATSGVPLPLSHFLKHNHALHERVLLVTVQTSEVPRVPSEQRAEVKPITPGLTRVVLHYGFTERPDVPEGVRRAIAQGELDGIDPEAITYIIGRETVIPSEQPSGMWRWREVVFAFVQRNSERTAVYFGVPTTQVVEIGTEIEI